MGGWLDFAASRYVELVHPPYNRSMLDGFTVDPGESAFVRWDGVAPGLGRCAADGRASRVGG